MTTLLAGRINTCRLPLFSALYIVFRESPSTLMRTMMGKLSRPPLPECCNCEVYGTKSRRTPRAFMR